jgi:hypothetical protein
MFLLDILKNNPLQALLEPRRPSSKSNYRATLSLISLKPLIDQEIVNETEGLESLDFHSRKGELILTGIYNPRGLYIPRILKMNDLRYRVTLKPIWVKNNKVRFKITSYHLKKLDSNSKWDLVYLFSRLEPFHKRILLQEIVDSFPTVFSLTKLKHEIKFDLTYFLMKIPSLAGQIEITHVDLDAGNVYFFIQSSKILKPLLDFFGPQYISIDYLT